MTCPNHPDREGEWLCVECARQFCAQCIQDVAGRPMCPECAAQLAPQGAPAEQPAAPPPPSQPTPPTAATPPTPPTAPMPPTPPTPAPGGYVPAPAAPGGFAIASMVCGILSLVCCCINGLNLVVGVVAVVLGAAALGSAQPEPVRAAGRPYAIAGIATGAAGIVLFVLALAGWLAFSDTIRQRMLRMRGPFREMMP